MCFAITFYFVYINNFFLVLNNNITRLKKKLIFFIIYIQLKTSQENMDSQTAQVCKNVIDLIKSLNISMETLIAFEIENNKKECDESVQFTKVSNKKKNKKKTKTTAAPVENDKKQETIEPVNNQELEAMMKEDCDIVQEPVKMEIQITESPKRTWFEQSQDDDSYNENFPVPSAKPAPKSKTVSTGVSYKNVLDKNIPASAPTSTTTSPTAAKPRDITKEIWEEVPKEPLFVTKNKNGKNLFMVYTVVEFVKLINEKKKWKVDFLIDDDAHCKHTFNGTMCPNIRNCNKVHVQRCMYGERCTASPCSFIHRKDMESNTAKSNFDASTPIYNQIKPKKQVKRY